MIGIRLAYDITHHLGMAGAYPLTFIADQIDRLHPIIIEAFKVSFPIFGLAAIGQLDSNNRTPAGVHGHPYRRGFRKDLITGQHKILDEAFFCGEGGGQ
jgi:hypothetical protein